MPNNYPNIKSKYLRKLLIESDKKVKKEMAEWWDNILPRKGSLLRQLVERELSKKSFRRT